MRMSDWSSDVCSSDLRLSCDESSAPGGWAHGVGCAGRRGRSPDLWLECGVVPSDLASDDRQQAGGRRQRVDGNGLVQHVLREHREVGDVAGCEPAFRVFGELRVGARSEEHTSELQSLMRISYAVFCLKKK